MSAEEVDYENIAPLPPAGERKRRHGGLPRVSSFRTWLRSLPLWEEVGYTGADKEAWVQTLARGAEAVFAGAEPDPGVFRFEQEYLTRPVQEAAVHAAARTE